MNNHFFYPKVAVGAVVFKDNKVLLVKRKNPPAKDTWAIPGGSVKLGETLQEAAEREIFEETGIIIKACEPIFIFDFIQKKENGEIQFHYVVIDLTADYISGEPVAGDDAADARWVSSDDMKYLNINEKTLNLLKEYCRKKLILLTEFNS